MKNILLTLSIFLTTFLVSGQDVVYNFNTDANIESFTQGGFPNLTATSGYLTTGVVSGGTGVSGGFQRISNSKNLLFMILMERILQ